MSRSRRKFPGSKENCKGMKRVANQALRAKKEEIPSGAAYRKYFDSWMISDTGWRLSAEYARYLAEKEEALGAPWYRSNRKFNWIEYQKKLMRK